MKHQVITPQKIEQAAARIIRQNAALNKTVVPDQFVRDSAHSLAGLLSVLLNQPSRDNSKYP